MNKDIAQKALEIAIKSGADEARVAIGEGSSSYISLLDGAIDNLKSSSTSVLALSIYTQGRYGVFSTNKMDMDELQSFIQKAVESTQLLAPDLCRTLPPRELYYDGKGPSLCQADPSFDNISIERKKQFILDICSEIDRSDSRLISVTNEYEDDIESEYMIDSHGLEVQDHQTFFTVSTETTVNGIKGSKPQNWWYDASLMFDSLPKGCAAKALQRTLAMINYRKIKSGKYAVVLDNNVSSKVIAPIFSALNGASLQQNNSFLLDSLGKQLFPERITISDNPHIIGSMGSRYYDSEGIATRQGTIIDKGVISTYYLNSYFANKLGMSPTIDSPSAPYFPSHDAISRDEMISQIDRGILITGFNGGNCNGATGDFSYGAEGFLFEKGVLLYPVKEINITGNILSLWHNILFVGNDPRDCVKWQIPSLAFDSVDIAGM